MKTNVKIFGCALILLLAMIACETDPLEEDILLDYSAKSFNNGMIKSYNNEMVLTWDNAISLAIDNLTPTAVESRSYAMVTLAMHDALNNVVPKYETYGPDNKGTYAKDVSKKNIAQIANAAVAQAAHDVLVVVAPGWKANADNLLIQSLSVIAESKSKERGIQMGKEAAFAVLLKRQNDAPPGFVSYPQGTLPGEYRSYLPYSNANPPIWPENAAFSPHWGDMLPFGMNSGSQFRPVPPNPVNSPEYTADYNEVKSLGCSLYPNRTQEQSDMAAFFIENSPSSINRIARILVIDENLNGWEAARLIALTHMIQADAHIGIFEAVYYYNSWRPITAIREGDIDGNDETVGDINWNILQRPEIRTTPPIPSYPSTRAVAGGAGAELFRLYFGTDKKSFTIGSYSLPDVNRSFKSFSQLVDEIVDSRVYVGYHFRQDAVEGEKMGTKLARFVYKHNLRELHK